MDGYTFFNKRKKSTDEQKEEMKKRLLRTFPRPYRKHKDEPYKFEEYQPVQPQVSKVRDFYSTMGYNYNEQHAPPAHYSMRTVCIDNDCDIPVVVGINNSPFEAPEEKLFSLQPKELRYILINSYGGPEQYLWPFYTSGSSPRVPLPEKDYGEAQKECGIAGPPRILANNANSFVLKQGVVGVWIQTFQYPTARGAS